MGNSTSSEDIEELGQCPILNEFTNIPPANLAQFNKLYDITIYTKDQYILDTIKKIIERYPISFVQFFFYYSENYMCRPYGFSFVDNMERYPLTAKFCLENDIMAQHFKNKCTEQFTENQMIGELVVIKSSKNN